MATLMGKAGHSVKPYVLFVLCLFAIYVVFHFGFEGDCNIPGLAFFLVRFHVK